jgi:Ca2+-binding EF-hand superfamily protein
MDRNDDGEITFDEYKWKREKPEQIEQVERWFKRIDKDGDKKLTVEEFKAAQKKLQPKKSAKKKSQPKLLKAAEKK